jgi:phytoene/squalene synthetase
MSFDADLNACAALVQRGDPQRFRAVMAAPVAARRVLFPLYAFNLEVARAPWVTQEPMIAEMRLQWWRDVCEEIASGGPVRRHEVATPLAGAIGPEDVALLDELILARRWDIYKDPFEDQADFERYLDQTAGHLLVVAARNLGPAEPSVLRDAGFAVALANWLRAIPQLEAAGRVPLVDGTPDAVRALARDAQMRLARARKMRAQISKDAAAALLHVGQADAVLRAAVADPRAVAEGRLPGEENTDRLGLLWRGLSGRW